MKKLVLLFLHFASFSAFASPGSLPNILCRFAYFEDQWHTLPAYVPVYQIGDQKMLGNIFGTYADPEGPGFAICTTRDRDEAGRMISFKMTTYSFEKEFRAAPGTCEVSSSGSYEVIEQKKVAPIHREMSTELTMHRTDGTKLMFINYFVSEVEEALWAAEPKRAAVKCQELFTRLK